MPRLFITIIFSVFVLVSWINRDEDPQAAFQLRISQYISSFETGYSVAHENTDQPKDKFAQKTNPVWYKSLTLKSKKTFLNKNSQQAYQRLFLSFYTYTDKVQCAAALGCLLQCFGGNCEQLEWNDTLTSLKITPTIYVISETDIAVCNRHCEQEGLEWESARKEFLETFAGADSKIISTGCGGPAHFQGVFQAD